MLARRFFYVSLGILALAVAYHLGATRATAEWNHSVPGEIVGFASRGGICYAFSQSGQAWGLDSPSGWTREPTVDLPVPVSDVKFCVGSTINLFIVTNSDEVWSQDWANGWVSMPAFPGGSTGVSAPTLEPTTWGKLKGEYAK